MAQRAWGPKCPSEVQGQSPREEWLRKIQTLVQLQITQSEDDKCIFLRSIERYLNNTFGSFTVNLTDLWSLVPSPHPRPTPKTLFKFHCRGDRVGTCKGAATFQKLGCLSPCCPYKRPTTSVKGVERRGMGRGVPSQQTRGLEERRKLPQLELGRFYAFLVHRKWEIPTSLY